MWVKITKAAAAIAIAGVVFGSGAVAAPSLTGSLTATYFYPDTSTVDATTTLPIGSTITCIGGVGDPICPPFAETSTLTASGLSITLTEQAGTSYTASAFNGLDFSNLVFDDASTLVGFALDTDLAGLTAANVSFTSNSIEFNAQGLSFTDFPYHVTLNLETTTSTSVPEPLTLSLVGAGLVGAVAIRRRKRKAA